MLQPAESCFFNSVPLFFWMLKVVVGLPNVGKAAKHGELWANDYELGDGVPSHPFARHIDSQIS